VCADLPALSSLLKGPFALRKPGVAYLAWRPPLFTACAPRLIRLMQRDHQTAVGGKLGSDQGVKRYGPARV